MTERRSPLHTSALLVVLCVAGGAYGNACTPESTPYVPVADVAQIMTSVLEPAAETYWDAVGSILDQDGAHDFAPETDEEWDAVRNAAFVIAETGNLLMIESRAPDQEGWIGMSQAMIEAGKRALAAAEARDPEAVFDAGAEVYYTCSGCHTIYATETLRPSDESFR